MTPDERNLLTNLANKIAQTPAPPRDPEAEDFIRTHIGNRPDALYLMTQTVMIQNMALDHAQQQLHDLQQRAGQAPPASGSSFLGGSQPQSFPPRPQPSYAQPGGYSQGYAQPPQYAAPVAVAPNQGGAPSFLAGAAKTAAGVAAGALAFEGIRSLFSHPGYGGFGGGGSGFMGGAPVEETVVNNYYDDPQRAEHGQQLADTGNVDNSDQYNDVQDDTEDDNAQLQDVDDSSSTDDSSYSDDSQT